MLIKLTLLFFIITIYTLVRYLVFGSVTIHHIPVYLMNKSIALLAVCCLFFAILNSLKPLKQTKKWAMAAFHFTYIHVVISAIIFNREYFPKLFDSSQMNLTGELTVLFGVLASYIFWQDNSHRLSLLKSNIIRPKVLRSIALIFILGHLLAMGLNGWLNFALWNGGLPPISLLSFIIVMISLLLLVKYHNVR